MSQGTFFAFTLKYLGSFIWSRLSTLRPSVSVIFVTAMKNNDQYEADTVLIRQEPEVDEANKKPRFINMQSDSPLHIVLDICNSTHPRYRVWHELSFVFMLYFMYHILSEQ